MPRLKESHSLPRRLLPRTRPELWRTLLLLIPLNLTVALLIWHFFPAARNSFIKEDRAVENMTAGLFALAFLTGAYNVYRVRGVWNRLMYAPVALLGAIGFLDELSWGERISRKHAPVFVSDGVKIDGVHDAAVLLDRVIHPFLSAHAVDIVSRYSFLLLLIAVWLGVAGVAASLRRRFPALLFMIPAVGCIFIGKYLDVREKIRIYVGPHQLRIPLEEMMELNGALCLFFTALAVGTLAAKSFSAAAENADDAGAPFRRVHER